MERLFRRAQATIFLERFAPILTIAGAPIAALLIISLFDGWAATPRWAHAIALLAAFGLSASLYFRARREKLFPARGETLARLENDGGVRHDALRALEDDPLADAGPLWDAHLAEMRELARSARLSPPQMTANRVDPHGLRYAALAFIAIGAVAAGADLPQRLISGFFPADPRASKPGFADLWIEPPAYAGKAPIYLLRGDDALPGQRPVIEVLEGSIVYAQVNAELNARLALKSDRALTRAEKQGAEKSSRQQLTLRESGLLTLRAGGRSGAWPIDVIEDRAPTVEFVETPKADANGRLAFSVRLSDDFGVVGGALRLRLDGNQQRPLDAPAFDEAVRSESRVIEIDGAAGGDGVRNFAVDLQAEPWAGLNAIATFIATDGTGQAGESETIEIAIPKKEFFNPLARAVVEQRQTLAVSPSQWRRAEWALSGLTLGPEYFFDRIKDYLLLRTAMWRVTKEAGGDYSDTVEDFWPLALQLEDETLELARQRLEAAKEALRNALENGADDSEIERLTEALRAALQQYLQALAQSGQQGDASDEPADEIVNAADIDAMLNSIRDLAKSGAQNAARQALSDLENLLRNLRPPSRSAQNGEGQAGGEAQGAPTGKAGDLIGRQRELADKSFERGQKRDATGDDLGDEQGAISGDLAELMKTLEGAGDDADPDGAATRALNKAASAMRRSEEALRAEEFESANEAMDRAIAALREGAENLARAAGKEAQGQSAEQGGPGAPMRDPLGRPAGQAYGEGVDVPEKSDAQKARELLLELRRRLSEGERTEEEIKYLERLLERF